MHRHLLRVCRGSAFHDFLLSYKNGRHVQNSRHFSSEMTAGWPDAIKSFLAAEKINQPTNIQRMTLPIAMKNKDLVGIARTGSGKTLAFVIPAVMKILKEREMNSQSSSGGKGPSCLILAPTRELAAQTADVFEKFRKFRIKSMVLVGDSSRSELSYHGNDVYIATPGRLLDLLESNLVDLSNVKYLVLDEADRMMDMGFEPQIRSIVEKIPVKRQTLMWSATWPIEIQTLAEDFMQNYEKVIIDGEIQVEESNKKEKPVKFTTSDAYLDYKSTSNFYSEDDGTTPPSHNIVLAGTGILGFVYLIFLRDDINNDGGVNLLKPVHESIPELAIPMLRAAIEENKKFGNNTRKLEEKLAEYLKDPDKYGGSTTKLIEN